MKRQIPPRQSAVVMAVVGVMLSAMAPSPLVAQSVPGRSAYLANFFVGQRTVIAISPTKTVTLRFGVAPVRVIAWPVNTKVLNWGERVRTSPRSLIIAEMPVLVARSK